MFRPVFGDRHMTTDEIMACVKTHGCHGAYIMPAESEMFALDFGFVYPMVPMRYDSLFPTVETAIDWWRLWCHEFPFLSEVELYIGKSTVWEWMRERNQEVTFS